MLPGFDSLFWMYCGPHGSASGFRERSFLTGQKGTEKPAATSEARGTAKGPAGPFGNPGALRRSPETLSMFHNPSFVFTLAPARACRNRSSGLPFEDPARLRGRAISRAAYTPPLQATGPCAANTKTTPAKLRRGGVKTPPYGFTEIANKIVNTNSRQVVGAACRPPVQFYLAANARCCVPVPAPCRAGACPRRGVLPCPQIPCLPPHPRRGQDARPTNLRKIVNHKFPPGRRGGLQAARAILSCRERTVLCPRSRAL